MRDRKWFNRKNLLSYFTFIKNKNRRKFIKRIYRWKINVLNCGKGRIIERIKAGYYDSCRFINRDVKYFVYYSGEGYDTTSFSKP